MTHDEIKNKVTKIFRDILDDETIVLHDNTTANDIEGWDSLSHISILYAIEKDFNIKFILIEVKQLKKAGDLFDLIKSKTP
jgi:acyl carrier protein